MPPHSTCYDSNWQIIAHSHTGSHGNGMNIYVINILSHVQCAFLENSLWHRCLTTSQMDYLRLSGGQVLGF